MSSLFLETQVNEFVKKGGGAKSDLHFYTFLATIISIFLLNIMYIT